MKAKDIRVDPEMELRDLISYLHGILYAEEYYRITDTVKYETMTAKVEEEE